jgi:hypothetical protein
MPMWTWSGRQDRHTGRAHFQVARPPYPTFRPRLAYYKSCTHTGDCEKKNIVTVLCRRLQQTGLSHIAYVNKSFVQPTAAVDCHKLASTFFLAILNHLRLTNHFFVKSMFSLSLKRRPGPQPVWVRNTKRALFVCEYRPGWVFFGSSRRERLFLYRA